MPIFEEVGISWKGSEHKIPPDHVMKAIAIVESEITLGELARASMSGNVPLAKVSSAYAALLRYAGVRVTNDEVYAFLFADKTEMVQRALRAVSTLQMLMIPPAHLREEETPGKKDEPVQTPS